MLTFFCRCFSSQLGLLQCVVVFCCGARRIYGVEFVLKERRNNCLIDEKQTRPVNLKRELVDFLVSDCYPLLKLSRGSKKGKKIMKILCGVKANRVFDHLNSFGATAFFFFYVDVVECVFSCAFAFGWSVGMVKALFKWL